MNYFAGALVDIFALISAALLIAVVGFRLAGRESGKASLALTSWACAQVFLVALLLTGIVGSVHFGGLVVGAYLACVGAAVSAGSQAAHAKGVDSETSQDRMVSIALMLWVGPWSAAVALVIFALFFFLLGLSVTMSLDRGASAGLVALFFGYIALVGYFVFTHWPRESS